MKRRAGSKPTSFDAIQFKTLYLDLFGNTAGGSTVTPIQMTPDTPTSLVATTISSASIGLVWSSTGENTRNYHVERSEDSGVTYTEIAVTDVSVTVYTDIGLTASTTYYYRVRASNDSAYSPYSNADDATTLAGMFATVLDNFNRANEGPPPSANWTGVNPGGLQVSGNECVAESGLYCDAYWSAATFGPDCEGFITVTTLPPTDAHLVGMKVKYDPVTFKGCKFQINGAGDIFWVNGYTGGLLLFDTLPLDVGDSVGIRCIGTTITIYHKPAAGSWTLKWTLTDLSAGMAAATGNIYLYMTSDVAKVDNFGGGTI